MHSGLSEAFYEQRFYVQRIMDHNTTLARKLHVVTPMSDDDDQKRRLDEEAERDKKLREELEEVERSTQVSQY